MARERLQLTEEIVERILANYTVVEDAGDAHVTVGTVSYGKTDDEGNIIEKFYWEDGKGGYDMSRQYAIVNLRAMSPEQFAKAEALFEDGKFEEAVGREVGNLSLRMDVEEVEKHNIAKGSIVKATFDWRENSKDEEVLVCISASPVKARIGKNSIRARLNEAKRLAKAQQEEQVAQGAETTSNIPNSSKAPTA